MLKEIFNKINSVIPNMFPVDPSRFNDPVATQTGWKSVRMRSSRASSVLVQKDPNTLSYKPSLAGIIMGTVFVLVGILMLGVYFTISQLNQFILLVISPIFALVGFIMILQGTSPVVFDRTQDLFYRGRKQRRMADANDARNAVQFSEIHALQLLSRLQAVQGTDDSPGRYIRVYEMNLVKHDSQRINVTTYGKAEKCREDANIIAAFISVPVWDGIDG